jgi:two-component system nitrogen regulation response regulator GlnG
MDLAELAANGRFLPELFYELSCFSIRVPELCERIEDLPMLAEHFLRLWSRRLGKRVYQLSRPVSDSLQSHGWPGNLRELQSVICQAVVRAKGSVLLSEHLPKQFHAAAVRSGKALPTNAQIDWRRFVETYLTSGRESLYDEALIAMEVPLLKLVLHSTEGNQARAAKILGMTRGRLRQKLRERGIVIDRSVAVHRGESRNVTDEMCDPADVA